MCHGTKAKILGRRLNRTQGRNPRKKTGITTTIVCCRKCGLVFPNPMPVPVSIEDHYGLTPEEYWKDDYLNIDVNAYLSIIKKLRTIIPYSSGQRTLDVGAGLGHTMKCLENSGYISYGIEPSTPFYANAIKKYAIQTEYLTQRTIEEAEFEREFFDFVTFGAVLEHLYDPGLSIQKALSWLRPGGVIHLEVPNAKWLSAKIFNLYYKITFSGFVANLSPMHSPFHLYEFTKKSFEKHGQINGYKLIDFKVHTCQTFLPAVLNNTMRWYMDKTKKGMQLEVWLQKN